jgi:hypothetical protein
MNKPVFIILLISILSVGTFTLAETQKESNQDCGNEAEASARKCMEELNMNKDYVPKHLSPDCMKQIESNNSPDPESPCGKELESMKLKIMECIKKNMSTKCRESFNDLNKSQKEEVSNKCKQGEELSQKCKDEVKRISSICEKGQQSKEKCFNEHSEELNAACSDDFNCMSKLNKVSAIIRQSSEYNFESFTNKISKYPYDALKARQDMAINGYSKISEGMNKQDIKQLMGEPDSEDLTYEVHNGSEIFTYSSWGYYLHRHEKVLANDDFDRAIFLYFTTSGKLYWAYWSLPGKSEFINQIGNPLKYKTEK